MEVLTLVIYDQGRSNTMELFNPVQSWGFIQSDLVFIDSQLKPFFTYPKALEQIAKEAPDVVIFNQNGDLEITDSACNVVYKINAIEYPYRTVLKYLEKRKILVKKVRVFANRLGSFAIDLKLKMYSRKKYLEDNSDIIYIFEQSPFNVQPGYIDFNKEFILDADTRLRIDFVANAKIEMKFFFEFL